MAAFGNDGTTAGPSIYYYASTSDATSMVTIPQSADLWNGSNVYFYSTGPVSSSDERKKQREESRLCLEIIAEKDRRRRAREPVGRKRTTPRDIWVPPRS